MRSAFTFVTSSPIGEWSLDSKDFDEGTCGFVAGTSSPMFEGSKEYESFHLEVGTFGEFPPSDFGVGESEFVHFVLWEFAPVDLEVAELAPFDL